MSRAPYCSLKCRTQTGRVDSNFCATCKRFMDLELIDFLKEQIKDAKDRAEVCRDYNKRAMAVFLDGRAEGLAAVQDWLRFNTK